jgi:hypothetical protein
MARNQTRIGSLVPLKNRAGNQRGLIAADLALEQLTVPQVAILCRIAPRTLEALGPTPGEPRFSAGLLIGIALNGLVVIRT